VVIPAVDFPGLFDFYTETMGFLPRGAFRVPAPPEFGPLRVRFLGLNERHHSLAICPAATQRDPGLIHMMVEVDSLDAVGQALDRVNKDGFQLSSTLGRHTNDKMVSFYVRAPGDWDIEFGTEGMRVDENHYTAEEITADSYWGHEWVSDLPAAMRP
jgi:3,4-dihydroxy-9,10-secoandrosta-1,3,5(10)-triene-9,17-dione 4,5-dioxygenase